jgi:hypothetical protein
MSVRFDAEKKAVQRSETPESTPQAVTTA